MTTLTFRQPRIVALILLVLVAAGASALLSIGRQEDPTITNIFATVTTPFPSADPARVETLVTTEIEDALKEIPEVAVIESASSTGISIVNVELIETLTEDRIEQVWSEIRDATDDAALNFPAGAMEPEFSTNSGGAYAAILSLSARHDGVPATILARYAEDLTDELRSIPGTEEVDIFGAPDEEVLVTLDPDRMAALGLTPDMVSAAIAAADAKGQAGRVRGASGDFVLNVEGEIEALDRLREVVVREGADGRLTRLGDLASVTRGPRAPAAEAALHEGQTAMLIAARLQTGLQVDAWMGFVRETVDAYEPTIPAGIELDIVFDQSGYTADRLAEVGTNMAIGVGLVIAVLLGTLGIRAAAIVALILPVVSLASLATMNVIGLPIHQMSVTGLIVALGLLVDAGIVMTDEIGRRIRAGMDRQRAVGHAVRRLFAPLFASTVTTALSFTPMILLPGPAGDFVGAIAIAVVIMLAWSFVIAITVTPAVAGWLMPDRAASSALQSGIGAGALGRAFRASLGWAVAHPVKAVAFALVLPITGFAAMPTLTAQFFPGVDRDQFHIEVDMGPGTAFSKTNETVARLDAALRAEDGIRSVSWVIGRSAPAFYYNMVPSREDAPGHAQALITTTSAAATEELLPRLQRSFGDLAPEAQVLVRGLVQGPPVAAPVELRFVGPDLATLRALGDEAREIVAGIDTVTLARSTVAAAAPEVSVAVDEAQARMLGLDLASVSRQLEAGLEGVTGGSLVEGTEQLPVRVRLGDATRGDLNAIADLPILPPNALALAAGGVVPGLPLSAIADLRLEPSESTINRRNSERVNTVQAYVLRGVLPEEALQEVQAELDAAGFALPPGYRLELGGDSDARSSTLNNLLASLGIIVTLSIAVIVMTFNSFRLAAVALVVSGLSAGLSLLALAIFQYPFGITAVIGVIGSIGVSINAAIIIMTGLQANARASAGDRDAMVDVVMDSSRHIVSTTVTTFGGFMPLILAGGGFWPPFAMAVAGGVLLSTVVSFYFTPPMFALVYAGRGQRSTALPEAGHSAALEPLPAPRLAAE